MGKHHSERCGKCKDNIYLLFSRIDGKVERQYDLDLPAHPGDYRNDPCFASLELIYEKLRDYRGHGSFVRIDKLPNVDYYLPTRRLVVEFDESQHFTGPRLVSLSHYPSGLSLGYDRRKWMDLSHRLDRKDNDPPYRDEQRAWYDTLRDFSSIVLGNQPTVRLYAGDRQWCLLDADKAEEVDLFRVLYLGDKIVSSSGRASY